jgi:hypothetical protein
MFPSRESKDSRKSNGRRDHDRNYDSNKYKNIKCYKCKQSGHYADKCTNTVVCHLCKENHYANECPNNKNKYNNENDDNEYFDEQFEFQLNAANMDTSTSLKNDYKSKNATNIICSTCLEEGHCSMIEPLRKQTELIICHTCKKQGHRSSDCPTNLTYKQTRFRDSQNKESYNRKYSPKTKSNMVISASDLIGTLDSNKVKMTIKFDGMWGKNSAYVHEDSELFKIKKELIIEFLKADILTIVDINERNVTAHVNINGDDKLYNELDGKDIMVSTNSFKIQKNFIEITLGSGTHYTIVYKQDILNNYGQIKQIIKKVLDKYDESSNDESTDKSTDQSTDKSTDQSTDQSTDKSNKFIDLMETTKCKCCFENDRDILFEPCKHIFSCVTCSSMMHNCPVCRTKIVRKTKIFNC